MATLSSAPTNRNNKSNKLLSAVFAIAASVSGSVNAATTPNFTEEPAGSEKLTQIMSAQQAILDMLPANHQSRQSILDAKKGLENGGDIPEITKIYNWAQAITNSVIAPPAAKEEAKKIIELYAPNQVQEGIVIQTKGELDSNTLPVGSAPVTPTKTNVPRPGLLEEKEKKEREISHFGPGSKLDGRPWTTNEGSTCKKVSFGPNGELDIGDSGYLQISQTLEKKDLPKEFEAFCESRMGLVVKVNYYDDKDKKLIGTFTVPANGEWTAAEKVPTKCTRAVVFVFITANDSNNGQKLPEINLRKPKKK